MTGGFGEVGSTKRSTSQYEIRTKKITNNATSNVSSPYCGNQTFEYSQAQMRRGKFTIAFNSSSNVMGIFVDGYQQAAVRHRSRI